MSMSKYEELDALDDFCTAMELRLDEVRGQSGKNGWDEDAEGDLISRFVEHISDIFSIRSGDTPIYKTGEDLKTEYVDAANYLMMLWDRENKKDAVSGDSPN